MSLKKNTILKLACITGIKIFFFNYLSYISYLFPVFSQLITNCFHLAHALNIYRGIGSYHCYLFARLAKFGEKLELSSINISIATLCAVVLSKIFE